MSTVRALFVIGTLLIAGCSTSNSATPTPEYDLIQLVEDFHAGLMEWDLQSALSHLHEDAVLSLEWSPDGASVELMDYDTPEEIQAEIRGIVINVTDISIYEAAADGDMVTFTVETYWRDGGHYLNDGTAEFEEGKIIHLYWNLEGELLE